MMKYCKKCDSTKPAEDFNRDKNRKNGLAPYCRPCSRLYYKNNKEKVSAKSKEWYDKNRETILEQKKNYYNSNKDEIIPKVRKHYRENRAYILKSKSEYGKLRRAEINSLGAIKRARKKERTPSWLSDVHKSEIRDFYWLAKDLQSVTGEPYHVDHIIPLSGKDVCGLHVPWNLQVLPADINISKGNKYDPDV